MRLFALALAVAVGVNALLILVHGDPWTWTAFWPSVVGVVGSALIFWWPGIRRRLPLPPRSSDSRRTDPPWAGMRIRTGSAWTALGLIGLDLIFVDSTKWSPVLKALTAVAIAWGLVRNRAVVRTALGDHRTRLRGAGFAVAFGCMTGIHLLGDGPVAYVLVGVMATVVFVWPKPFRP